jgi:hypothetical protein
VRSVLLVASSLLLVLGVTLSSGVLLLFADYSTQSMAGYAALLLILASVVCSVRWFHMSAWPATAVATAGLLEVVWGMCWAIPNWPDPAERMDGLGSGLLYIFCMFTIGGGSALVLAGLLSLAAQRLASNAEGPKNA